MTIYIPIRLNFYIWKKNPPQNTKKTYYEILFTFLSLFYDRIIYCSSYQMVLILFTLDPTLMLKLPGGGDWITFPIDTKQFIYRNHNPVLDLFMADQQIYKHSNTTGTRCGAGAILILPDHLRSPRFLMAFVLLDL